MSTYRVAAAVVMTGLIGCSDPTATMTHFPRGGGSVSNPGGAAGSIEQQPPREWSEIPDEELWASIAASDREVIVGLRPDGAAGGLESGRPLLTRAQWESRAQRLFASEGREAKDEVRLRYTSRELPHAVVQVSSLGALRALRKRPDVYFVEPARMIAVAQSPGCGAPAALVQPTFSLPEGDIVPIQYRMQGISEAWTKGVTGAGVTIGYVDTGTDNVVPEFTTRFAAGASAGRSITRLSTMGFSFFSPNPTGDGCGHGTRVAGVIGAPRDGLGGVGIAYGANLLSVEATPGSVVNWSAVSVAQGIIQAADQGAWIISMAIGSTTAFQSIRDAISYAARVEPGRRVPLLVAAAGTWTGSSVAPPIVCWLLDVIGTCPSWIQDPTRFIVFPASEPDVIAVTAMELGGWVPSNVSRGPKVEFAMIGDLPGVATSGTGWPAGTPIRFRGSSAAVSAFAGAAALVWSRFPTITRDSLLAVLRCSHAWTPRCQRWSTDVGYGAPDVLRAIGGISQVVATATPAEGDYCWHFSVASVVGGHGPYTYYWPATGSTSPSTEACFGPTGLEYPIQASLEVYVSEPDGASREGKAWFWAYP